MALKLLPAAILELKVIGKSLNSGLSKKNKTQELRKKLTCAIRLIIKQSENY